LRRRKRLEGASLISSLALVVVLFCMLALMVMGGWNLFRAVAQRSWKTVACQIISSRIEESFDSRGNRRFKVLVMYSYEYSGQKFQGDRVTPGLRFMGNDNGVTSWAAAEDESKQYAAGTQTRCYVNPRNPSDAALRPTPLVPGIVCLTAPLFLCFLYGLRFPITFKFNFKKTAVPEPLSAAVDPKMREARQALFWGAILAIMGGFCSYFLFLGLLLKSREAKSWPEVKCVILESGVREGSTRHGKKYEPDVLYEFEFQGQKHRSNHTHFDGIEPDRLSDTSRFLTRFPAGTEAVCYVNPKNPKESVLDRSFPLITSFYPLIGFCMFGGGLAGAVWGLRTMFKKKAVPTAGSPLPGIVWGAAANSNPVNLRPLTASTALLFASFGGIAVCGAIIAWRVLRFWHNWHELGVIEFSLMEILILIFLTGAVAWLTLRCWTYFDPHPALRLDRGSVALGDSFDLEWTFTGPVGRLRSLTISLEGREETMAQQEVAGEYGRHKSEKKVQEPFYREALFTPETHAERVRGQIRVPVPCGLMPTFNAEKTKIVWIVQFHGDIAWSPKMKHEFPINILPEGVHA